MPKKDTTIKTLDTIRCEIHHIHQKLENVIHPDISKELMKIYDMCDKILAPIDKAEEKADNKNRAALDKIKKENKIKTSIWSMGDIPASDMHKKTPPITKITYKSWGGTQVHDFDTPTSITWLEFWQIAENMIVASGDNHHVFIENLYHEPKDPDTHFRLVCGS